MHKGAPQQCWCGGAHVKTCFHDAASLDFAQAHEVGAAGDVRFWDGLVVGTPVDSAVRGGLR